jgi:adenine-specific DNA-methyltransferase
MAPKRKRKKREVKDYRHDETRPNNPPAGMMADYEPEAAASPQQRYSYDPHLDPDLRFDAQGVREQAERLMAEALAADDLAVAKAKVEELRRMQELWLQWSGKAEHTSFEVENVPLYVHDRLSTQAVLRAVQREEA